MPPIVTAALIVNEAAAEIAVGVPEMVPIAGSKVNPAGSVPVNE